MDGLLCASIPDIAEAGLAFLGLFWGAAVHMPHIYPMAVEDSQL